MSAVEQQTAGPAQGRERPPADDGLACASLRESAVVLATGVVPALARGLFSPRRHAMKLLTALNTDRRATRVLTRLRRKYDGDGVRLLGGRLVVLWGAASIREVLEHSADVYAADAGAKAKGMAHFQPDALTLSHGDEWRDRRAFTEAVLASDRRVHPLASRFLAVVGDEARRLTLEDRLTWEQWQQLFDHVTLRVIFGDGARQDQQLTHLLEKLMRQSNRLIGLRRGDDYYEFYAMLERRLREPEDGTLLSLFAQAPQTSATRVAQQLPHWMFAMRDTLAANAYRALAAIVADPAVESRVRKELAGAELSDPAAIDGMRYLEGCLQEAMRLWPTTPLLAREVIRDTTLAGERLEPGTQVLLLNVFNHRDADQVQDADRMAAERWVDDGHDVRFNHLSNGAQDCPGAPLVLLLGKAALARTLERCGLVLEHPPLEPGQPLPHMLDFFQVRFAVRG